MADVKWPHVYGLSWTLKRTATFGNTVQSGPALGYEARIGRGGSDPIFKFELSYEILKDGSLADDRSKIEAFFLGRRGSLQSFLLDAGAITKNPLESSIVAQPLLIDDNGCAPLIRTSPGGYNETIYEMAADGSGNPINPVVKHGSPAVTLVEGTDYQVYTSTQTKNGALNEGGISYAGIVLKFIASPEIAGLVYADFGWNYRMRFAQDELETGMFHYLLWKCQTVQLIGCRG